MKYIFAMFKFSKIFEFCKQESTIYFKRIRVITCKMYLLPMLIRIHQIRLFNNIGRIRFINVLLLSMYYCCTRRCHCTRLVVLVVWHSMSSQRLKVLYTSLQKSMALTFIFPAMPLFLSSQNDLTFHKVEVSRFG